MPYLAQPKWLVGVTAVVALCGASLFAASFRTERRASELPRMTCDDLLRKGAAAPQFVTLADVHLCQAGHAMRRDMDSALEMYVPIYSNNLPQEPRGADLVLLLEILDDRERGRLLANPDIGELTVELWTDAATLDPWVPATLATFYPGLKTANCR